MSKLSQFFGGGGGFGGGMPTIIASTDQVVESNTSVGINTSDGQVTVTLPSNPDAGDRILFFDAALTWDVSPAIIDTGGNRVEQDVVELTSYALQGKGGVQELMYVGGGHGWKDVSLYVTSINPFWYGSDVLGGYSITSSEQISTTELMRFNASGDFTVSEDGVYCIEVAAGSAGKGGHFDTGSVGGNSALWVNGSLLLESEGIVNISTTNITQNRGRLSSPHAHISPIGFIDPSVYLKIDITPTSSLVSYLNDAKALGITPITIPGARTTAQSTSYYTFTIEASSILLPLKAGDNLTFVIGARGSGIGANGSSGAARLHLVQGLPL